MKIRKLKIKDAVLMIEWMHDESVVKEMHADFKSKRLEDCIDFIKHSFSEKNKHFAITSDSDEYMGTVSLKNISNKRNDAEFAIAIRKCAMQKGYSWFGMREVLSYGFEKIGLDSIYWCVSKSNQRACKFYNKHNFKEVTGDSEIDVQDYMRCSNLIWYKVSKADYDLLKKKNSVLNCKIINIKTVRDEKSGALSFFEANKDMPFGFKRFYYITNVSEGCKRGFHAHKKLKQLVFCPYGKITLVLDNGCKKDEILLNDPSIGVLIEEPIWREMIWMQENSVLCVAASEYYDENDYIRNYDEFLKFVKEI